MEQGVQLGQGQSWGLAGSDACGGKLIWMLVQSLLSAEHSLSEKQCELQGQLQQQRQHEQPEQGHAVFWGPCFGLLLMLFGDGTCFGILLMPGRAVFWGLCVLMLVHAVFWGTCLGILLVLFGEELGTCL